MLQVSVGKFLDKPFNSAPPKFDLLLEDLPQRATGSGRLPDQFRSQVAIEENSRFRANRFLIWVFPKILGKPPKWMVYNGKPY